MKNQANMCIDYIKSPKSIALADKIRELERGGRKIIKFQTGDPDFKTHPHITDALKVSLARGETHYSNSQGLPMLREAISGYKRRLYHVRVDPSEEMVITLGGAQAIFLSLMTLLNPGDEVVLLEPYYPQYEYIVKALGGAVKIIPVIFDRSRKNYTINFEILKNAINKKTKAIIINSPNNPSGKILSQEEILHIVETVRRNNIYVISDEVYSQIIDHDSQHVSLLEFPQIFDRLIYINSFSKTFAMTGWRLGYSIAPPTIIRKMLKLLQLNSTCVPLFIQKAGVAALESQEVQEYTAYMRSRYNVRRKLIYNLLADSPLLSIYPDGAFYFLLRVPKSYGRSVNRFSDSLLKEKSVAVVPAQVYGSSFRDYFRISFSIDETSIKEGIRRIIDFLK